MKQEGHVVPCPPRQRPLGKKMRVRRETPTLKNFPLNARGDSVADDCYLRHLKLPSVKLQRRSQATGDFICRHHVLRGQLYMPSKQSFSIPLKYLDAVRQTKTNLENLEEKIIQDFGNVDGYNREVFWCVFLCCVPVAIPARLRPRGVLARRFRAPMRVRKGDCRLGGPSRLSRVRGTHDGWIPLRPTSSRACCL